MRCLGNNLSRYISKHSCFSVTYHFPLRMAGRNLFSHRDYGLLRRQQNSGFGKGEVMRHCDRLFPFSPSTEPFQGFLNLNFNAVNGGKLKWNLLPSSLSYGILKKKEARWQVFYEWDLCFSGLIILIYVSKENRASSFLGHFYSSSLGSLKKVPGWGPRVGGRFWHKWSREAAEECCVRAPTKHGSSGRGKRDAQSPLLLPPFFTKCHRDSCHWITHQTPLNWHWGKAVSRGWKGYANWAFQLGSQYERETKWWSIP